MLQRQLPPATDRDRRESIEETTSFLRGSADYYADPAVKVDQATVSRVLDSWYRAITAQEQIASGLGGDPALSRDLRTAYSAAVASLLRRAAALMRLPLPEVYRLNRGRIPVWAWQEPHHLLPGFSTPVPVGREADLITGTVNLLLPGLSVSILPDAVDKKLGNIAETSINLRWTLPHYSCTRGGRHVVTDFGPLSVPTATIQTFYGPRAVPANPAAFGRGTTAEDVAGSAVGPWSGTLGFHEGQHGMDYVEFLRTHAPPVFGGRIGMTARQFDAAGRRWAAALTAYEARADAFTLARTDCVGVTKDQWKRARAAGRRVRLVCPARPRH